MSVELHSYRKQNTLTNSARVSGFGYWSGKDVTIEFHPASPGSGVRFFDANRQDSTPIQALVENRIDVPRRTNLVHNGSQVEMVEHVLAALAGLQIDNCDVICTASEMPGCDGSCWDFVSALCDAGIQPQDENRLALTIARPVRVEKDNAWIEARPLADAAHSPRTVLQYNLDYGSQSVIVPQSFRLVLTPESFVKELCSARTFVSKQEADQLRAGGLGARVTTSDLIVFDDDGPIDTSLRFSDECARHKTLDMVGDFALAGIDLLGEFEACRAGHHLNAALIREIFAAHNLNTDLAKCA